MEEENVKRCFDLLLNAGYAINAVDWEGKTPCIISFRGISVPMGTFK
jgi:hypothetical protein